MCPTPLGFPWMIGSFRTQDEEDFLRAILLGSSLQDVWDAWNLDVDVDLS